MIEMAKSAPDEKKNAYNETQVVDLDVHVMQPEKVQKGKAERMSKPWSNVVDPDTSGITGAYRSSGLAVQIPGEWDGVPMVEEGGIVDAQTEVKEGLCKEFGVDVPVLNMGAGGVDAIPEADRREQEMRATNDVLLDMFLDDNPELYGVATISTSQPSKAAEEIDRIADEDQIVGLYGNSAEIDPPLGDPQYDIMYQAAEENNMSFVLHSGVSGVHYPQLDKSFAKFLPMHSVGHPMSHIIQLTSIIYEGVPEKFPGVNFFFTESGIGWAAYMMARMNREVPERKFEVPLLEKTPEEYVQSNCFFGNQPLGEFNDPKRLQHIIQALGPENIVYASDYPHFDFDYPSMTAKHYKDLAKEETDKIFHGNAIEALDFPDRVLDKVS